MSETQVSKSNSLLTFLGSLGAILIFVLILFLAYLPNRPEPVNAQTAADRQAKADESRAAGIQKISNFEVINAESGTVRIPIEDAMEFTVAAYDRGVALFTPIAEEVTDAAEAEAPIEQAAAPVAEVAIEEAAPEVE